MSDKTIFEIYVPRYIIIILMYCMHMYNIMHMIYNNMHDNNAMISLYDNNEE